MSTLSRVPAFDAAQIVEVDMSEAAFTSSTESKPIVATYGCEPCIALGGYHPVQKIAFMIHFTAAVEVIKYGRSIFSNLSKLRLTSSETPIQLHIRSGGLGYDRETRATVKAIKEWMNQKSELPMVIASEEKGTSLLIDARTGQVSIYDLPSLRKNTSTHIDTLSVKYQQLLDPSIRHMNMIVVHMPKV